MGRLIGYMANRADRLADALHQEREVIALPPSDQPAGWGIGFYQGGEVLHKKRPLFEGRAIDWQLVAKSVRSDCVVAHVRHATVGDFRAENTHPFRMRSWLFVHHGTIGRFDAIRERLRENLPDFIQRNIRGVTDSEHFFHVVLSFLHDAGQLDHPDADPKIVLSALRSTVRLVDQLGREVGAPEATLNVLLTNGRRMYAVRRGAPLFYVERQGIHDPMEEREPTGRQNKPSVLRYVMVVSNGDELPSTYEEIAEGSVCVVDRDLDVQVHSL